jgi:hypothetical protein
VSVELAAILAGLSAGFGGCYPSYEFDLPDDTVSCGPFSVPAASSLSDDFGDATPGPNWSKYAGACANETDGELVVTLPANDHAYCGFGTKSTYHLTCDSLSFKVPAALANRVGGVQTFVYLTTADASDQEALILLEKEAGRVVERRFIFTRGFQSDPDFEIDEPYDPSNDLWWRISEAGGELFFSTSPDGASWNERGHGAVPMSFDDIFVRIGAGNDESISDPGEARFDCYNIAPPCP